MPVQSGSTSGVSTSAWIPLNPTAEASNSDGIFVKVTGSVTYSVEVTGDNIWDPNVTPTAFPTGVAALTAATTSQAGALPFAARAVRVNQTGGAGSTSFQVVSRGR